MKAKNNIWNKFIWFFILLIVFVAVLQGFGAFNLFEIETMDLIYQHEQTIANNIYVIGIDETTLSDLGYFEAWSREKIADIINVLSSDPNNKPAVIALDIYFDGNNNLEIDKKLATAIKNAGNVILASSFFVSTSNGITQVEKVNLPFSGAYENAYGVGVTNAIIDNDGVIRSYIGSISYNGQKYNSFAVATAKAYMERMGRTYDFSKYEKSFYINYFGKSNAYYGSTSIGCSFSKVLSGEYPVSAFKDAIVLIGTYSFGMQDEYYTSISKRARMFGVEIQANVVNQVLVGEYKHELSKGMSILFTLLMGLIAVLLSRFLSSKISIPINIGFVVLYVFVARMVYSKADIILPIIYPIIAVFLVVFFGILYSHYMNDRERKKMIDMYGKYLSKELAQNLADNQESSLILGGTKKDVAVLFVDIRGFTTLSEKSTPEEVVDFLNKYFKVTASSIIDEGGTIDKFIGDATMGLFNALVELDDYVYKAVCAGLDMIERSESFNDELPEKLRGKVKFGVGVHCGEAVIGNIGTDFRMEFTAIGDTINTSSRIEGKAGGNEVWVSEDVYKKVKNRFVFEDAGEVPLKGKEKAMHVYKVIRKNN